MDPNAIHTQPNFDLPEPQRTLENETERHVDASPEKSVTSEKEASVATELPITAPLLPLVDPSQPSAGTSQLSTPSPVPTPTTTPLIADDVDLIEKEWVSKAKSIVEKTRNDPHLQNRELNRVKADYIKKRYNKEIKIVEE